MIVSASRRTDIPSFYAGWFLDRVKSGFCEITNPFNNKKGIVSLKKEDVIGFVFWSKNYTNFSHILDYLFNNGYNFYLNYTINNYPKEIETISNTPNQLIIDNLLELSKKWTIFWRYDPIYISKKTDFDFHINNFNFLCSLFKDRVDRVIVNFVQEYPKVIKKLQRAVGDYRYIPLSDKEIIAFAMEIREIANKNNIKITTCTDLLHKDNTIDKSSCVDKEIFERNCNTFLKIKESPTFKGCHCDKSVDIGFYHSCKNGCSYCYAM